jgi:RHS repeat-associated protein
LPRFELPFDEPGCSSALDRTTYSYDSDQRRIQAQDALGNLATVDPLGRRTTFSYDSDNRQTQVQDALGNLSTTVYDAEGNVLATVDPLGRRTTYSYDSDQRRIQTQDALGNLSTTVYDTEGNVLATVDPLGHRITFSYDSDNRQIQIQDALGNLSTTVCDGEGNVLATVDPRGNRTTYSYDSDHRRIQTQDALGNLASVVYDSVGNTIATVDARGYRTTVVYDGLNRAISRTDPLNHTTTTAYDAAGNVVQTIDALGNVTTSVFDTLNRRTSVQDPGGGIATSVYDAVGNVVNTIDPVGNKTTSVYDSLNRRTQTTDPRSGLTTSVYDAAGNQTALVDPDGNRSSFVYDALNRVIEKDDPLGAKTTFAFDAAGRLTSQTDRLGRRQDFSYDNANRLTGATWRDAGGSVVNTQTFTLDANGNQLTAADANGTYTLSYDALNRVSTQAGPFGLTLTFSYDAAGNSTQVQDSKGGVTTSVYDGDNQLTSRQLGGSGITALRFDLAYTARNQVGTLTRYSDLAGTTKVGESDYTYDNAARLTNLQIKDGSGGIIGNYTYTYDVASRVSSESIDGTTTSFSYDAINELTSAGSTNYGYDAAGDRNTTGYQTGTGNRMTSDGIYSYSYDAAGNRTKKTLGANAETWTFGYDHNDHMTWAEDRSTDGGTLTLRLDEKYDVFGRRIEEDRWTAATGTVVLHFGFEDGRDLWADLDSNNTLQTRYVRLDGPDALAAKETGGGTVGWYGTDRQGSVRLNLNSAGALLNRNAYDTYGQLTSQSSPSNGDRFAYTGAELQSDVGLQLQDRRWYDPKTGRWTTEDPIGFGAGDANINRYLGNSPANGTDPSGLELLAKDETSARQYVAWLRGEATGEMADRWGPGLGLKGIRIAPAFSGRWVFNFDRAAYADIEYQSENPQNNAWDRTALKALLSTTTHVQVTWLPLPDAGPLGHSLIKRETDLSASEQALLNNRFYQRLYDGVNASQFSSEEQKALFEQMNSLSARIAQGNGSGGDIQDLLWHVALLRAGFATEDNVERAADDLRAVDNLYGWQKGRYREVMFADGKLRQRTEVARELQRLLDYHVDNRRTVVQNHASRYEMLLLDEDLRGSLLGLERFRQRLPQRRSAGARAELSWVLRADQLRWMIRLVRDVEHYPELGGVVAVRGGYFVPVLEDLKNDVFPEIQRRKLDAESRAALQDVFTRLGGAVQIVAGFFELSAAAGLAAVPEPTFGTKLAAVYLAFRAPDES